MYIINQLSNTFKKTQNNINSFIDKILLKSKDKKLEILLNNIQNQILFFS